MVAQAIRCECFSRVTKSGFLVAHIVDICETTRRVFFANREDPDEMLHFIRVFTVCKGKLSSDKRIQYFF